MEDQLLPGVRGGHICVKGVIYSCLVLTGLTFAPGRLFPQTLMHGIPPGGTVQLIGNDSAVLESDEAKKDLPCTVTPVKPILGFDLRFHSGYEIAVPLSEIAGDGDTLTIIFRVTSALGQRLSLLLFAEIYGSGHRGRCEGRCISGRRLRHRRGRLSRRLADARPYRAGLFFELGCHRGAVTKGPGIKLSIPAARDRHRRSRSFSKRNRPSPA